MGSITKKIYLHNHHYIQITTIFLAGQSVRVCMWFNDLYGQTAPLSGRSPPLHTEPEERHAARGTPGERVVLPGVTGKPPSLRLQVPSKRPYPPRWNIPETRTPEAPFTAASQWTEPDRHQQVSGSDRGVPFGRSGQGSVPARWY